MDIFLIGRGVKSWLQIEKNGGVEKGRIQLHDVPLQKIWSVFGRERSEKKKKKDLVDGGEGEHSPRKDSRPK